MSPPGRKALVFTLVAVALIAVPFLLRLSLLETRGFNPDELEHLHWSWCVSKGLVPYRDYFDHHTPWLHYFFSPWFEYYDVERVADDAIAFILTARRWMWLFAGVTLALTFALGKSWRDGRTGLVACLLLANTDYFLAKSLEVRPAVPAAALVVAAILLSVTGVRRLSSASFFASGLLLGAATMFTQKVLFTGPGFALAAIWFLVDGRLDASLRRRIRLVGLQTAGFLLPPALTLAYFASEGALWRFIDFNFLLNARWPGLPAGPFVIELVRQDLPFVLLAAIGFAAASRRAFRVEGARNGEPLLALVALSSWATLPLHPAMSYQHFLLVLPVTAVYAGAALVALAFALTRRSGDIVLALAVIVLSVQPMLRFRRAFDRGNWGTLQAIEYVLRNSAPWETTLDGFTGLGLFRPQAFFHHFQHPHAFALQSAEEHREMMEALRTGRAMPKLIFWSHYLRDAVTPEMARFLEEHYVPTGLDPIRVRSFDNRVGWWSDEETRYLGWDESRAGDRSPHVLFDDGWREPGYEQGLPVRRTRTRSSKLIVPIRYPKDFEITLRAHADADSVPFGVELLVNGRSAGVHDAVPRWQDYSFRVTVHPLRPGFNELELRFSESSDSLRSPELAVHSLKLTARARSED